MVTATLAYEFDTNENVVQLLAFAHTELIMLLSRTRYTV